MKAELWMRENAEYLREQKGEWPPGARPGARDAGLADPTPWSFRERSENCKGERAGYLQGAQGERPHPARGPSRARPRPARGLSRAHLWAVLSASRWVVPLEAQDSWGLLGGQRAALATQGPVSLGRVRGPSQP